MSLLPLTLSDCSKSRIAGRRQKSRWAVFHAIARAGAIAACGVLTSSESCSAAPVQRKQTRLYVNYSAQPSPEDLAAFNLCILDSAARVDLSPGRALGNAYLAYISTVEAAPGSRNAELAAQRGIPIVGENPHWASHLLDVTHPAWAELILDDLADAAAKKGFDGFFLDTLDSAALLSGADAAKARLHRGALVGLIHRLHSRFPDKPIVLNRGFDLIPDVVRDISGVLVESVFQTFDPATKNYHEVPAQGTEWLIQRIREVQNRGLTVYAIDYVDPVDTNLARRTAQRLTKIGCVPLVTTPELNGRILAPVSEISREVRVLFGWNADAEERPCPVPAATQTAARLQGPLEWLGYKVEFWNGADWPSDPPAPESGHHAGILIDPSFKPRGSRAETAFVDWLLARHAQGERLLFAGALPARLSDNQARIKRVLGLNGSLLPVPGTALSGAAARPVVSRLDSTMWNTGIRIVPTLRGWLDLQAPSSASIFLSLQLPRSAGTVKPLRFDPVFLTSWGGCWLDPYVVQDLGSEGSRFLADPVAFLTRWLGERPLAPVPDTTTRDGRRVFVGTIGSEGFNRISQHPGSPTCAEVVRDRILAPHPLPVTVAMPAEVVTSAPAAESNSALSLDALRQMQIARSVIAPMQIVAACSLSGSSVAQPANLTGAPKAFDAIFVQADVNGRTTESVFRSETLLDGSNLKGLILPAHGIMPLGLETESGYLPIVPASILTPQASLTRGAFRAADWIRRTQEGDAGQRLAPAGLHHQFGEVESVSGYQQIESAYSWVESQPFRPVDVAEYGRSVRDAHRARIYETPEGTWIITNSGHLRTLRLPAHAGIPDLAKCEGVSGFSINSGVLYIHTTGKARTVLALDETGRTDADYLHIAESSGEIEVVELSRTQAIIQTGDLVTPVEVTFGGIAPGVLCKTLMRGESAKVQADPQGRVKVTLQPRTTLTLKTIPLSYAIAR